MKEKRGCARLLNLSLLWLLAVLVMAPAALGAEEPPYEFSAEHSLTGSCKTSGVDPVPDPGCPDKKPPKAFAKPTAIAIDSHGYEYVLSFGGGEGTEGRIDVFSPEGVFVTEIADSFGPRSLAVDSKGVLYVFDKTAITPAEFARYKPLTYKPAEGKIEYGSREVIDTDPDPFAGGVAVDGDDHVFVDWSDSIKEYGSAEAGNELLDTITHDGLRSSTFVALDQERRRLYASSCPDGDITKCWVLIFDADSHELLEEVKGPNPPAEPFVSRKGWISIAVDEGTGDFFIGDLELDNKVYQFNENYELVSTLILDPAVMSEGGSGEAVQIAVNNAEGTKTHRYLFVPSPSANRALAFSPPKEQPPVVETVSVASVGANEAELQATIKPSGGTTTYTFQIVTQQAYEEAGNSFSGVPITREGTIVPVEQEAKVSAVVDGLAPGTVYRFRVFAANNAGSDEEEASFSTYSDAPVTSGCSNQALRIGYSAFLPDCRAYELVTPADTGGQIPSGANFSGDIFPTVKASPSGNVASFLTHGGSIPGLGGSGSLNGDLYLSTRTETGWSHTSAGPSGVETTSANQGSTSPDQHYSFWAATKEGSAVIEGRDTHYVRYADGRSELVGRGSINNDPRARGKFITENGTHIVFETNPINTSEQPVQLEPNAPPTGTRAVYDRIKNPAAPGGEETRVVSLLPGDETPAAGQNAEYLGASSDGEGIAFTIGGTLYLRVNNEETFEAGPGVTFAGVSEGGERIFYMEGGDLKALDTTAGPPGEEIAFTNLGNVVPVNVAKDGSRAYFVSTSAIPVENPLGALPVAGQRNLYLSEEGAISFVATVTARDVEGENTLAGQVDGLGLWTTAVKGSLAIDPSRLNPDGSVMLFQSRANIDGYDPDEDAPQIYRYDHTGERLHCISCIPTRQPATDGASLQTYLAGDDAPPPLNNTGFVPNLRADGKRAFFESTEALVSRDSNGVQDVYEWEEQGVGGCTTAGGCVYLITSGQSAKDNYLYAHSNSGDDVFFATADVLVAGDDDTLSIYDARVGGGFPEPAGRACEGEGCRPSLAPAPHFETPSTKAPSGDAVAPKPRRVCPKGKRKVKRGGKVVCVKKKNQRKKKQGKKKAGKNQKGARR